MGVFGLVDRFVVRGGIGRAVRRAATSVPVSGRPYGRAGRAYALQFRVSPAVGLHRLARRL